MNCFYQKIPVTKLKFKIVFNLTLENEDVNDMLQVEIKNNNNEGRIIYVCSLLQEKQNCGNQISSSHKRL